ncbi:MAG TPA: hypothetical protein VFT50_10575 [Baekduia sp.]|nr:hypothetical protein [Baekduia sp.]
MPITLVAALIAASCALLAVVPAAQAASRASRATAGHHHATRHHAKRRHRKRCPRGRVRLRVHGHRRCVAPRLAHAPSASSPALPALRAGMLRLAARGRTKHGRLRLHVPKRITRAIVPAEAALTAVASAQSARARRPATAHAALDPGVLDHLPPGTPTETLEREGWKVETHLDAEAPSVTVRRGSQSMTMRLGIEATSGECPDADGEDAGRSPVIYDIDVAFPVQPGFKAPEGVRGTPATAFLHLQSDLTSTTRSHDTDDAHLVDLDLHAKYVMNLQLGLKDAAGKVLVTNEPTLATVHLDATHVKPMPEHGGERAWITTLLRHTTYSAVFANISDQRGALEGALMSWGFAAIHASRRYRQVESEHWQKDCLDITAAADKQQLHWGEHSTVTVTGVTARGGTLRTPIALTTTTHSGTLTPSSPTFNGVPIPLDFAKAAEAGTGSVTFAAKSRMGLGQTTVSFGEPPVERAVRLTSDATQTFDGGDHGTGTASWAVSADVALSDYAGDDRTGPIAPKGSGPLTETAFSYSRHGALAHCQDGKAMSEDFDGTGTDPGTLVVDAASVVVGDDGVSGDLDFRVVAPVEHELDVVHPGASACAEFQTTLDETSWANSLRGLASPPIAGVSVTDDGQGHGGRIYHVSGGWQRGTGEVMAYRDLTFPYGDVYGPMQVHLRLELIERR